MKDAITSAVFLLIYLLVLEYAMVEHAPRKLRANFGIKETVKRYKRLDEGVKRHIRLFVSIVMLQYVFSLFGGIEWFMLSLFFAPFVVYAVILIIYEYS